ncbi:MAG: radical SAM protein [Candidatus Omnitrophota bacterium]
MLNKNNMALDIPEIEYDTFFMGLLDSRKRPAEEGALELTYRCNLDCVHCYCNAPELKRKDEEITFAQLCRLMDELAEEGCLWLALTGGEPFVRDDFLDLYLYAKKKGFFPAILTNATLIDERTADFLKEWPARQIEISLYGVTAETHEAVTQVKGSFKKTIQAIHLLQKRKSRLEIKTMVLTINRHEIKKIREFAKSLGAKFRYDHLIHSRLNGDKTAGRVRLTAGQAVDMDIEMGDLQEDWQKQCKAYAGVEVDCEKLYTCGAGRAMFSITPYGLLQTCSFPLRSKYNVTKGSFREGWRNFIPEVVSRKRMHKDFVCRDCQVRALCSQCANWAYLENKDEEKEVDYICAVFKERVKRFGIEHLLKKEAGDARDKSLS